MNNSFYSNYVQNDGGLFGAQSLRVSNAVSEATAEFYFQTYSAPTLNPAGEDQDNKVFDGTFQFISTSAAYQPGLQVTVSPDNGSGGRMSFVGLKDVQDGVNDGIQITFFETNAAGGFVAHDVGMYSRNEVHTIRFLIEFVPGVANDGAGNDVLRLFVDGVDIGERDDLCFTTWESFYVATGQAVPVTDSFEFRVDNSAGSNDCALNGATRNGDTCTVAGLLGGGYLFDNVTTITRNTDGPEPTVCGVPEVGVIAPTGTTCSQYRDGTESTLPEVQYTTKSNAINSVSPGVFFYYTKVSDGKKGDLVDITEENNGTPAPYAAIPVQQGQVFLYDASTCTKLKWAVTYPDPGQAQGTLPSDGTFIIGVKYDASALRGEAPSTSLPVTYSFGTDLNSDPVDTGASVNLAPKH